MTILDQVRYKLEVVSNDNSDDSFIHLECRNPDTDTSTDPEDIWDVGGTKEWQFLTQAFRFSSDDVNDTLAGDGARVLRIWYLNDIANIAYVDYETEGTTDVTITETGVRFLYAEVLQSGVYHGSNIGNITIEWVNGKVVGKILTGVGKTQNSHYSIATNKIGILQGAMSISANGSGIVEMYKVENLMTRTPPVSPTILIMRKHFTIGTTPIEIEPMKLSALTDIWVKITKVDSNNTDVSFYYSILLRPST